MRRRNQANGEEDKNEEWIRCGSLRNKKNFWERIRATVKGSHKEGQVCGENGQVICEEDQVRVRWKEYFARTRLEMC